MKLAGSIKGSNVFICFSLVSEFMILSAAYKQAAAGRDKAVLTQKVNYIENMQHTRLDDWSDNKSLNFPKARPQGTTK